MAPKEVSLAHMLQADIFQLEICIELKNLTEMETMQLLFEL